MPSPRTHNPLGKFIATLVAKILNANTASYALGAAGIAAAIAKELARAALKLPGTC